MYLQLNTEDYDHIHVMVDAPPKISEYEWFKLATLSWYFVGLVSAFGLHFIETERSFTVSDLINIAGYAFMCPVVLCALSIQSICIVIDYLRDHHGDKVIIHHK